MSNRARRSQRTSRQMYETEPNGLSLPFQGLMSSRHSTIQAAFPTMAAASPPARRPSAPPYSSTSMKTVDATMPTEQVNMYACLVYPV